MEGNVWENSTDVRKEVRGDEDVEDVGDGRPSAEGDRYSVRDATGHSPRPVRLAGTGHRAFLSLSFSSLYV
jgi:hypothetical protein